MTAALFTIALAIFPLATAGPKPYRFTDLILDRRIEGRPLLADLEQFRKLLKTEWMLSNLTDADFDKAVDAIAKDAKAGMTGAELAFRLQRVIALGADGHARVVQFGSGLRTVPGPRPNFLIDLAGDDYAAFTIQFDPLCRINPRCNYRFEALKPGYPLIRAIDSVPMAKYVAAAKPFICRGTETATRLRAMELIRDLPMLRREMGLPNPAKIRVTLATADGKSEVELEAPTTRDRRFPFPVPRPDEFRILDDGGADWEKLGYVWIRDCYGLGTESVIRAMPNLRDSKGIVLDLRDNEGGNAGPLEILAAHLLPPDKPRRATGSFTYWAGVGEVIGDAAIVPETEGLSDAGKQVIADFRGNFEPTWQPPKRRATESRTQFLARKEAEPKLAPYRHERFPKTYHYPGQVVVLYNHRCFSAAEITLSALKGLDNVTLVGTPTTAGGAGSGEGHRLNNSQLDVILAKSVYLCADGTPIDGMGVKPDVVVQPDGDTYTGGRDRMLDVAIKVLREKIAAKK